MMVSERIENYPGFPSGVSGAELSTAMHDQVLSFGAQVEFGEIVSVGLAKDTKIVSTEQGDYTAKTVILAMGAKPRRLGIPSEQEFRGKGVSYCATCDGPFYKGKRIAVVGGGDSAVEDACYLTRFTESVTIIHRRDQFRAAKMLQERVFNNPKINVVWDSVVEEIKGDPKVGSLVLRNVKTNATSNLDVEGLFVLIGQEPDTSYLKGQVELDEFGYIPTDIEMRTNLPGVFAAGDVRQKTFRQIVTACADGAMAANSAEKYVELM